MNTNDEKIQWHPAFDAALQIEFGEEAEYLEFDSEHLLSKKPMQIDVLIKNEKHVKIQKNIGRIFRQYNIIEYKSPELREKMNEGVPTELERLFFVSSDANAVLARTFEEHRENLINICFSSL